MSNSHHPYALEVVPSRKPGHFDWVIRRNGKILERSDRLHRSQEDALKSGERAIDRYGAGSPDGQR